MTRQIDLPNPDNAPAGVCWQYGPDGTPEVMTHCGLPKGHEGPHAWEAAVEKWREEMISGQLEYFLRISGGNEVRYCVRGPAGAVDFHCRWPMNSNATAGLEFHHRSRPSYMREREPDFGKCEILEGPCWCDGTSLYATEWLLPLFKDYVLRATGPEDDIAWRRTLEAEYRRHFLDCGQLTDSDEEARKKREAGR